MSKVASGISLTSAPRSTAGLVLLSGFAVSLFASAFLLFSVQPLVSRLVLPRLGGSPAVWNTCICFFQAALLLGYGYAHLVSTRLQPRAQVMLHAVALVAALALMPLSLGLEAPPADASPIAWLFALLTSTVGLPFVTIAATAPLLQTWFARTTHPQAHDPYFLYAASNAGSLLALLSYPLLIEMTLDLSDQLLLWSAGLAATAAAVLACGAAALSHAAPPVDRPGATAQPSAVAVAERVRWLLLAFVPSALMLAVTTHITTDVAAVPLFWVVPLAIYILTFVLAFAQKPLLGRRAMLALQGVALAAVGLTGLKGTLSAFAMLVPLAAFALTAAVCHTELASRRPEVRHLTGYFFLISVGGALGGLFNALLAPVLFQIPLEYPLLMIAACLLRPPPAPLPTQARENWAVRGDLLWPGALVMLGIVLLWAIGFVGMEGSHLAFQAVMIVTVGAALLWFSVRRVRLALGLTICFVVPMLIEAPNVQVTVRSFFGVSRVVQIPSADLVVLQHGTTMHGARSTRPGEEFSPVSYYRKDGPFGRLFTVLAQQTPPVSSVGVLGLGIGGLGCYARPGEAWTFYEIDPTVETLARDDRWFHFMTGCGNRPAVVLGDARIKLAADPAVRYDMLFIDAFSSDSVPVHLITREALSLYLARLKPGGIVLFHVSNRYLDLVPVVTRLAADAGASVRHLAVRSGDDPFRQTGAEVVAVGLPGGRLDALAADGWDVPPPGPALWTDERSNILDVIRWR